MVMWCMFTYVCLHDNYVLFFAVRLHYSSNISIVFLNQVWNRYSPLLYSGETMSKWVLQTKPKVKHLATLQSNKLVGENATKLMQNIINTFYNTDVF